MEIIVDARPGSVIWRWREIRKPFLDHEVSSMALFECGADARGSDREGVGEATV
jgi:hypothetical protein